MSECFKISFFRESQRLIPTVTVHFDFHLLNNQIMSPSLGDGGGGERKARKVKRRAGWMLGDDANREFIIMRDTNASVMSARCEVMSVLAVVTSSEIKST